MFTERLRYLLPLILVALATVSVACGSKEPPTDFPTNPRKPATVSPKIAETPFYTSEKEAAKIPTLYAAPPPMTIDQDKKYTATIHMEKGGEVVIELFPREAPNTVNNFVFLSRAGFYDEVTFHRVIAGFMAQSGDPTATGTGEPGYRFDNEFSPIRRHDGPGVVSMANSGIRDGHGTNGSQFFIMYREDSPRLDGLNIDGSPKDCTKAGVSCHSVFGQVAEGMDVVDNIIQGDVIETITIEEGE